MRVCQKFEHILLVLFLRICVEIIFKYSNRRELILPMAHPHNNINLPNYWAIQVYNPLEVVRPLSTYSFLFLEDSANCQL